ncbi:hypothetical protein NC652_025589 [Populus alba x Populus x berolinensis]|nr:hypothetical protein NC652_025589 [Populus alba x Populus x berolinensis]
MLASNDQEKILAKRWKTKTLEVSIRRQNEQRNIIHMRMKGKCKVAREECI